MLGIILGPIASKFLDAERWGSAVEGQQEAITLVSHLQPYTLPSELTVMSRACVESSLVCNW
jgi:hypothetical protein